MHQFLNDGLTLKFGFFCRCLISGFFLLIHYQSDEYYLLVKLLSRYCLHIVVFNFLFLLILSQIQLVLIYLLAFENLYQVLKLMMDVMLSFLLQFYVVLVLESSLKFQSFLYFCSHACSGNTLFVLTFQFLLRVVSLFRRVVYNFHYIGSFGVLKFLQA